MSRLRPGQPLAGNLKAAEFNRHVDAAEWYHRNKALGEGGGPQGVAVSTDILRVKNGSGGNLGRGSVVGIGERLITSLDLRYLWYDYATPSPGAPWGILRRAAPQSAIEEAQVSGVTIARLNVTDLAHRCAYVTSGSNVLQSTFFGPVQLLEAAAETGEQEMAVLLGHREGILAGVLTSALQAGASAPVAEVELDDSNAKIYTGRTFTVFDLKLNSGQFIDSGVIIDFAPMSGGRFKWIAAHCQVSDTLPEE